MVAIKITVLSTPRTSNKPLASPAPPLPQTMVSSSEASYIIETCLDDFPIDGRSRSEYRPYSISNNSSSRRRSSSHLSRKNGGGGGERHDDDNDDDRRPPRPVQRIEQGTPSRIVHRRPVQRQGRPRPSVVVEAERGSLRAVRRPVAVVWRNRRRNRRRRRTVATTGGGERRAARREDESE